MSAILTTPTATDWREQQFAHNILICKELSKLACRLLIAGIGHLSRYPPHLTRTDT